MSKLSFLIAPDKFKGSLSAREVAETMRSGIRDIYPSAKIYLCPLADGGDGTARILSEAAGAKLKKTKVHGPLGKRILARWGLKGPIAYIDVASCSGLALLKKNEHNPLKTSTRGLGELILAATNVGARKIVIGLGGSATIDGGVGAMKALGIKFLNRAEEEISSEAKGIQQLNRIDSSGCLLKNKKIELMLLSDVENPLLGKLGAARVFGLQKGATSSIIPILEKGLKNLSLCIQHSTRKKVDVIISGGAAGGIPAGFVGVLGSVNGVSVKIVSGIEYVLTALDIKTLIRKVDYVLTAEGRLDSQTLHGKAIAGLTRFARKSKTPVIAFAGQVQITSSEIKRLGLTSVFAIAPGPCTVEESFRHAVPWLRKSVENAIRLLTFSK